MESDKCKSGIYSTFIQVFHIEEKNQVIVLNFPFHWTKIIWTHINIIFVYMSQ